MNESIREVRVVRGNIEHGRRPFISFMGARYSSQALANSLALIGQRISLVIDPQNILALEAFDESGHPIGKLEMKSRGYLRTLKTLDERREFLRENKRHRMAHSHAEAPVDEIGAYILANEDLSPRKREVREKTYAGGAMQALLEKHPKIAGHVQALSTTIPCKSLHQIHFAMLKALRDKGVQDVEYPFTSHDLGMNALRHHLDALNRKISR